MRVKINSIILFLFLGISGISAQGVRVSYTEMTSAEKTTYAQALYTLKNNGFIDNMAQFHSDYFASNSVCCNNTSTTPIHFNFRYISTGSGTEGVRNNNDVFLAWHRRFLFEFEQELKSIDLGINLPYWDWTSRRSTSTGSGQIWQNSFLGQFNNAWNLNRALGQVDNLPTSTEVSNLKNETNWNRFTYLFEGDPSRNINSVHAKPHSWVGGTMSGTDSPGDPVFYLHHAMVDKIWQEWIEDRGSTSSSNLYGSKTSMPRYDGTYAFNGNTRPRVNPDTMINSDEIGVFYAENQQVILDNYTVSNQYQATEVFKYRYEMDIGDNFIIPSGTSVAFDSPNIVFSEGFHAQEGSTVVICNSYGGSQCQNYTGRQSSGSSGTPSGISSSDPKTLDTPNEEKLQIYPNPFGEITTVAFHLEHPSKVSIELLDLKGRIVKVMEPDRQRKAGTHKLNISGENLSKGIYLLRLRTNDYTETKRLVFNGR